MKATKLVMLTALVSFTLMSFANAEFGLSKNLIQLKSAIQNPKIAAAIQNQIKPESIPYLDCICPIRFTVTVGSTQYIISGFEQEWRDFFYNERDSRSYPKVDAPKHNFSESNPFRNAGKKPSPFSEANTFGKKGKKTPVSKKPIDVLLDKR